MHAIFFGFKRVHLRVVAVTRDLLRGMMLTPARFDMMRIVAVHDPYGVTQSKIRRLLGVSAPTVSRMLKSLQALGFVSRKPCSRDARDLLVSLTEEGRSRVSHATRALVDSGVADTMVSRGLDFDPAVAATKQPVLQAMLSYMRRVYGDAAPYLHPWGKESFAPYCFTTLVNGRITYGAPALM